MDDVESLNRRALRGELDITKLSFHAYLAIQEQYELLNSGSALGHGCGPLLLSSRPISQNEIHGRLSVAIPGEWTTANLLCKWAFPGLVNKREVVFSEIEELVLTKKVDLGLVIHESRFTYAERGLHCVADLGELWEDKTQLPIPLGGIVAKKGLGQETITNIDNLINESIRFAKGNPAVVDDYIMQHAQSMERNVVQKHIDLYVNSETESLTSKARQALQKLSELQR